MIYLGPIGTKFQILNQNARNRRHRNAKFLAPASQRFTRTPIDWLLNPNDIVDNSNCYWKPKGRGARFASAVSVKVLFTNLKIWLLFGNVLKLNFLLYLAWTILKVLVSHYVLAQKIFCSIIIQFFVYYIKNVNYFSATIWYRKRMKLLWKILEVATATQQLVKHPIYLLHKFFRFNYQVDLIS